MRDDKFGWFTVLTMVVMLISLAAVITVTERRAELSRIAYEQCVADIPGYLDAQEVLYQEQECKP
jgi:hypothetical protein